MLTARVTLVDGLLDTTSTVTIGTDVMNVPLRTERGGNFAPQRILEAIDAMGFRAVDYRLDADRSDDRDAFVIRVEPKTA